MFFVLLGVGLSQKVSIEMCSFSKCSGVFPLALFLSERNYCDRWKLTQLELSVYLSESCGDATSKGVCTCYR